MKQTIVVKLDPSEDQFQDLLSTLEAFNRGVEYVARIAFERTIANKKALQPFVYGELRAIYGLSSQMAIRAIAKACDAYKRDKKILPTFDLRGAMVYDDRIMSFRGLSQVSLLTLSGWILIPLRLGAYQAERIDLRKGQADLLLREGIFFLSLTIDLPSPPPADTSNGSAALTTSGSAALTTNGTLGVDLGIVNIAFDSEGEAFSGEEVRRCRSKYSDHRKQLQKKKTRSAKRCLKKIRRKESRFQRNTNHCISKKIVRKALNGQKALALENLEGIRERVTVRKSQRYERNSWAFHQLRFFITYKAGASGVPIFFVDPAYTSRTCIVCGCCEKENRRSQSEFLCIECGFQSHADFVGSINIARRGEETRVALSCDLRSSAILVS